jgi:hypothetical protein
MELAVEKNDTLTRIYDDETDPWKVIKKDKGFSGKLGNIEETLVKFGLLKNEAKVYLYLARAGEKKAAKSLKPSHCTELKHTEPSETLRKKE